MTLTPDLSTAVGTYNFELEIKLADYQDIVLSEFFSVEVGYCSPVIIKQQTIRDFIYEINADTVTKVYPTFA